MCQPTAMQVSQSESTNIRRLEPNHLPFLISTEKSPAFAIIGYVKTANNLFNVVYEIDQDRGAGSISGLVWRKSSHITA